METETCFLETRFLFQKKNMSYDRGWKRKHIAFPFPRKKNSLSVVNSPVAKVRGSIDPRVKKNVSDTNVRM